MIADPDNVFELLQNEIAAELMARDLFQDISLPDGSAWAVLTEDEGDIEFMFTQMISACGLSVIVQSPIAHTASGTKPVPEVQFDPLSVAVSISEAIIFNRGENGTQVRLMRATKEVISALHTFKPPTINKPLAFTEMLKDRDTHPETGQLVASRICLFEVRPYFLIVK
jgi:hypothetical protein